MIKYITLFILIVLPAFSQINSNIILYEYWTNNDFANKTQVILENPDDTVNINFPINVNNFSTGMHSISLRFKDDSSRFSLTQTKYFVKLPAQAMGQENISPIVSYEYWVDNNFQNKEIVAISPADSATVLFEFNASNLATGLHSISLRFKDEAGKYSACQTKYFVKLPAQALAQENISPIVSYEYWIDNNTQNKEIVEIIPADTATVLYEFNAANLPTGLHSISLRFQDEAGKYSACQTKYFVKLPAQALAQENISPIVSYEYWVDNNFQNKEIVEITAADTTTVLFEFNAANLPNGSHSISLRFKDELGNYSLSHTKTFLKDFLTENISLSFGWNTISSNILPNAPNMEDVFAEIEDLVIVKNADGQIYEPAQNVNQIGDWNIAHGYMVYVTAPATLQITGTAVNPTETEINLVSGWNLVAYFRNSPLAISTALEGISSSVILVKNNLGQLYYPFYGLNTLGNMQQGQGYWLYMNSNAVLVYPGN